MLQIPEDRFSDIFYNGSFTYESEGGGVMKLRDMVNSEGVAVESDGSAICALWS